MTRVAGVQVCVLVVLLGALAGIGIAVATDVVSRMSVGGQSWSLSGNGALVVLFSGLPAVLAGGWAALARWRLRDRSWGMVGIGVGVVALVAAGVASFGPVLAVSALGEEALRGGVGAPAALGITFVLPPLLALGGGVGASVLVGGATWNGTVVELGVLAMAVVLVAVAPGAFFLVGPLVMLPLLAALPVLFSSGRGRMFGWGWLAVACGALAGGLVGGVLLAQRVQGL